MTPNHQVAELTTSRARSGGMFAVMFAVAAVGYTAFALSTATAHQTNSLSGSGDVLGGALEAPGAVQVQGDPSVPDAGEALRNLVLASVPAVDAPTF